MNEAKAAVGVCGIVTIALMGAVELANRMDGDLGDQQFKARQTAVRLVDRDSVPGLSPLELMDMYHRADVKIESCEPGMRLPELTLQQYERVIDSYK